MNTTFTPLTDIAEANKLIQTLYVTIQELNGKIDTLTTLTQIPHEYRNKSDVIIEDTTSEPAPKAKRTTKKTKMVVEESKTEIVQETDLIDTKDPV